MKYLSIEKLKDAKATGGRLDIDQKPNRIADALEKMSSLFAGLIKAIMSLPAPVVKNDVKVNPTPVDVEVRPEINVAVPSPARTGWMCEVVSRDSGGNIKMLRFMPLDGTKPKDASEVIYG